MEEEDIRHQRTLRLQRSAGNVSCTYSHYVALSDQIASSSKHAAKVCPSILVQVSRVLHRMYNEAAVCCLLSAMQLIYMQVKYIKRWRNQGVKSHPPLVFFPSVHVVSAAVFESLKKLVWRLGCAFHLFLF